MNPRWIAIAGALVVSAVGCGGASSSGGGPGLAANRSSATSSAPAANAPTTAFASSAPTATAQRVAPTSAAATGTAADVTGAPTPVSLGFNNSSQMVSDASGHTSLVWVYDNRVQLGRLSTDGALTDVRTVGGSRATLPGIAAAGGLLAVSWIETLGGGATKTQVAVSTDAGATFGAPMVLGHGGSGLSVKGDGTILVAVWHEGDEDTTAKILFSRYDAGEWSRPVRVDESSAVPLWASVATRDNRVVVAWRDNRSGQYSVWLRRSTDGGKTWLGEQHVVSSVSGDPAVCISSNGAVWLGHHGRDKTTVLVSKDGAAFLPVGGIGNGYFVHLDCHSDHVVAVWEEVIGNPKAAGKKVGWTIMDLNATVLGTGAIDDGGSAQPTGLESDDGVILLWVNGDGGPSGTLRSQRVAFA
jgi:hypothetical protein